MEKPIVLDRGAWLEFVAEGLPKGFRAVLSLRAAGDMGLAAPRSKETRAVFYGRLGLEEGRVLSPRLIHSRKVIAVKAGEEGAGLRAELEGGADGLVVGEGEAVASVTVADCMPIWLVDRRSGAFGLLHSGWQGTGILAQAVGAMGRAFGSAPPDLAVILGPSIGPCCYRVGEGRAAGFAAEFGPASASRRDAEEGSDGSAAAVAWYLDLGAANLGIAERSGIGLALDARRCTRCGEEFGSFRRQGQGFTRMLALAGRF